MSEDNKSKIFFAKIFQYLFESAFVSFLLFFLFEYVKKGIITNYFNFSILLTSSLFFGIIIIIIGLKRKDSLSVVYRIFTYFFSIISAIILFIIINNTLSDSLRVFLAVPYIIAIGIFISIILIFTHD